MLQRSGDMERLKLVEPAANLWRTAGPTIEKALKERAVSFGWRAGDGRRTGRRRVNRRNHRPVKETAGGYPRGRRYPPAVVDLIGYRLHGGTMRFIRA